MKAVLVNYNFTPDWLLEYPELEVTIYDRSDDGIERNLTQFGKVYKTANWGDVDFDKLSYLIENYDDLPEVFLWGKTNLFKYVDKEYFDKALKANTFKPLLKQDHKTYSDQYGVVCKYQGEMYMERADSWFFNATRPKYFFNWLDWCLHFHLPQEAFIPFAPGGNYFLTRDRVRNYSRDMYEEMRSFLPHSQRPAEGQACERSYNYLFR